MNANLNITHQVQYCRIYVGIALKNNTDMKTVTTNLKGGLDV